jgi:hypothetical protein
MSLTAEAQTTAPVVKPFMALCETTESVGFNWEQGRWVQVTFKPERYVVKKIIDFEVGEQPDGSANLCAAWRKPSAIEESDISLRGGCYSISEPGEKQFFKWCEETQTLRDGKWALRLISCDDLGAEFNFLPDEFFTNSTGAGAIEKNVKSKDSMAVGHGKCSTIG